MLIQKSGGKSNIKSVVRDQLLVLSYDEDRGEEANTKVILYCQTGSQAWEQQGKLYCKRGIPALKVDLMPG